MRLQWTYIYIIHSDDRYGIDGNALLTQSIDASYIHIAKVYSYRQLDTFNANYTELHSILDDIMTDATATFHGVVLIGGTKAAFESVTYARKWSQKMGFIFSDGIVSKPFYANELNSSKPLILSVSPVRTEVKEFVNHWNILQQNDTILQFEAQSNPLLLRFNFSYFPEHYRTTHAMRMSSAADDKVKCQVIHTDVYVNYAIRAVYSMAKAIKDVFLNKCSGKLDQCFRNTSLTRSDNFMLDTVSNLVVKFRKDFRTTGTDIAEFDDTTIEFDESGDNIFTSPQFEILHYRRCPDEDCYGFVKVNAITRIFCSKIQIDLFILLYIFAMFSG